MAADTSQTIALQLPAHNAGSCQDMAQVMWQLSGQDPGMPHPWRDSCWSLVIQSVPPQNRPGSDARLAGWRGPGPCLVGIQARNADATARPRIPKVDTSTPG